MLRLKEFRIKKRITQKEIADFLGVNQNAISMYESEKRKLDQDSIVKLSLYLDITPDDLLGFDDAYREYSEYLIKLSNKKDVQ